MTVIDHLADEPLGEPNALLPQAAAELAQELALVSNALFAQLFPGTPMRAIAGVAGVDGFEPAAPASPAAPTPSAQPVEQTPVIVAVPSAPAPVSIPVDVPAAVVIPIAQPVEPPPAVPPIAVPIPVPVAVPLASADVALTETPPVAVAHKPEHLSLAMLEEIGFLDE